MNAVGLKVCCRSRYACRCAASCAASLMCTGTLPGPFGEQGKEAQMSGKLISVPHWVTGPQCMNIPSLAAENQDKPGACPEPAP